MIQGRSEAASILLNENKVWITGGYLQNGHGGIATKTTEILDIETLTFSTGPDLPTWLFDHCMVKYNESHIFIGAVGSYAGEDIYKTPFLVDIEQDPFVFHALPDMSFGRDGAGCSVLDIEFNENDDKNNKKRHKSQKQRAIIVAGGYRYNDLGFLAGRND